MNFDLLLPRKVEASTASLDLVLAHLQERWSAGPGELAKETALAWPTLAEALQLGCQQGRIMYDLALDVYRYRPLTDAPIDPTRLEVRDARERAAFDLLSRRDAVKIRSENRIPGSGLELTGEVAVAEDRREYRPRMLLTDEGQASKAECTCPLFRKHGLKAGPCTHLIALRLAYARQEARKLQGLDPGRAVLVETRSFSRRGEGGEEVYQVSLERRRLKVRWGLDDRPARLQTFAFDSNEAAGAAFLARVSDLRSRGFLDAAV